MKEKYRHFKGGIYEIVCEALDSEDLSELIVYRNVKTGETWVRSKEEFFGKVQFEKERVSRFEIIK